MREVSVKIADREYTIQPLPYGPSKAWRQKLQGPFQAITGTLREMPGVELTDLASVGEVIAVLSDVIIQSPDELVELLFEYAPALEKDREYIEANAYDEELIAAFVEVVKLAYPFSALRTLIGGSTNGRRSQPTRQSSPSPSGV